MLRETGNGIHHRTIHSSYLSELEVFDCPLIRVVQIQLMVFRLLEMLLVVILRFGFYVYLGDEAVCRTVSGAWIGIYLFECELRQSR